MEADSKKVHLEQKRENEDEVGGLQVKRTCRVLTARDSDLITFPCVSPPTPVALDLMTSLASGSFEDLGEKPLRMLPMRNLNCFNSLEMKI